MFNCTIQNTFDLGYIVVHKCNSTTLIHRLHVCHYIPVNKLHELAVSCFLGVPVSKWDHHTAKMDFQHRAGGKTGSGGVASTSESNRDRRERLRQLALETIDINKDPYFMKNHLGSYECKLCLTLHNNEVWKYRVWLEIKNISLHLCILVMMYICTFSSFTGELFSPHTRKETSDQFVSADVSLSFVAKILTC